MKIMLIDDDPDSLEALTEFLSGTGYAVVRQSDPLKALDRLAAGGFDLVITDLRMPQLDGLELLRRLRSDAGLGELAVIILTGYADTDSAIAAMRMGAYDYLRKPVDVNELEIVVRRCADFRELCERNALLTEKFDATVSRQTRDLQLRLARARAMLRKSMGMEDVVAFAPSMRALLDKAELYHRQPHVPVMIEGETGTGKEVMARLVHHGRELMDAPFIAINCTAVAAGLFESELCGYEAGAFTGGQPGGARGKLELAGEGTLLLDEIGDMPVDLQPKLLRIIQERSFYRVGGLQSLPFRARLICASNGDLEALVRDGRLRSDLYYRLRVGHMVIPPLRERPEDIRPLAELFLVRAAARCGRNFSRLDEAALELLQAYSWPGNVRQLENAIERAVLEGNAEVMTPKHLWFLSETAGPVSVSAPADLNAEHLPERFEGLHALQARLVRSALNKFSGNITATSRYLGVSRNSLYCLMRRHSIAAGSAGKRGSA